MAVAAGPAGYLVASMSLLGLTLRLAATTPRQLESIASPVSPQQTTDRQNERMNVTSKNVSDVSWSGGLFALYKDSPIPPSDNLCVCVCSPAPSERQQQC